MGDIAQKVLQLDPGQNVLQRYLMLFLQAPQ